MRPLLRSLLPFLLLALSGCGNGTLADIWDSFPEEAFNPPDDGGEGGGGGGGVTLTEVAALAGGQGVTGTVKNIALATVAGDTYAFLAAGPDGCHIVDVTAPDLVSAGSYVTTIRPSALTAPAEIAGGSVDAIAIVDGTYLVCVAVAPAATNSVSVFHIPTLITAATASPPTDISAAFVMPPATGIVITGDVTGKGGGVSGAGGMFFVATGTALAHAGVAGTPPLAGWTVITASVGLGTPAFTTVTDVVVNQTTAVYASGKRSDGKFGFAVLANPTLPIPSPPTFVEVLGAIQSVADASIAAPGNYPLDLGLDTLNLYVTGNNEVLVYNATNPFAPALVTTLASTGSRTISVSGSGGAFAIGAGDAVRAGTNLLGQARVTGSLSFPGTYTVRGVAIRSTSEGVFLLVCAGTGGLRVVEVPRTTSP
jgi:hypothetical protein